MRPTRPNAGVQAWYQKRLDEEIEAMHRSILYWVKAEYRKTGLAQDENPAIMMRDALRRLSRHWEKHFSALAVVLSRRFVDRNLRAGDVTMRNAFKRMGLTVKFQMTESMRTRYQAEIAENVNLIRSIPEKHLTQVETLVMQSVARGRDLGTLSESLQKEFGVTRRRAALIARDQNAKATSILQSQRQMDLGIEYGIWKHSHAGKVPRPSHVKADGKKFRLSEGLLVDGELIYPGSKINCRCTWQPVIEGFE